MVEDGPVWVYRPFQGVFVQAVQYHDRFFRETPISGRNGCPDSLCYDPIT